MHGAIKIKLDKRGEAYWSFMLIHEDNIMLEVVSKTFNAYKPGEKWKQYEMASNRFAKEIMHQGGMAEQKVIAQMFMSEDDLIRSENSPTFNNN